MSVFKKWLKLTATRTNPATNNPNLMDALSENLKKLIFDKFLLIKKSPWFFALRGSNIAHKNIVKIKLITNSTAKAELVARFGWVIQNSLGFERYSVGIDTRSTT